MLDEFEVVAGPVADVGLQLRQPPVQIWRLQVVDDYEQINVRLLVSFATGDGTEQPGTAQVGPCREPLAEAADQLTAQASERKQRTRDEVAAVQ